MTTKTSEKISDTKNSSPNTSLNSSLAPKLAPPGAGIPVHQVWINKYLVKPLIMRKFSWESCETQFQKLHHLLVKEFDDVTEAQQLQQILVPPQMGLEDSSRFWSMAMTTRHLTIVGSAMENTIVALSHGHQIDRKVDTAKVKPELEKNDLQCVIEYKAFADGVISRLQNKVQNKNSSTVLAHPWFGDMYAKDWLWLMGIHTSIHLKQIRAIKKGIAESNYK